MAEQQESDGVTDEAQGNLRMGLMTAAQLARSASLRRRSTLEQATRRDLDEARQIQARLDVDRMTARAELAPVHEASWWEQAETRDVARAYETAVTWRDEDEAARAAEGRIRHELRERYQIEVNETGADPATVRDALARNRAPGQEAAGERENARRDRDATLGLVAESEILEYEIDREDERGQAERFDEALALEEDANRIWDSAARREEHAERISQAGEPEAAAAWKQADVDQARSPSEAVRSTRPKQSLRPKTKTRPNRAIERGGR
ncbi:hypothetical protein [Leucobacter sp. wl10]|uniref:hypothetical protein n=1 Tax=Leucobacter sp. wl10 TaxID=2304677 RepID=UPI000E5AAF00|nr:hypothetical protein [Leucobacter sp. wl10]RGE19065.1 hypothetical protein D1J51_13160 [Leucobacter sp. wl10]